MNDFNPQRNNTLPQSGWAWDYNQSPANQSGWAWDYNPPRAGAGAPQKTPGATGPDTSGIHSWLPGGWMEGQNEAWDALSSMLTETGDLGQQMFANTQQALLKARGEQLEFARDEALKRGIGDSGILSEMQSDVWDNYATNIAKAQQEADMFTQNSRWQAINAMLGTVPQGLNVYNTLLNQERWDEQQGLGEAGDWGEAIGSFAPYIMKLLGIGL